MGEWSNIAELRCSARGTVDRSQSPPHKDIHFNGSFSSLRVPSQLLPLLPATPHLFPPLSILLPLPSFPLAGRHFHSETTTTATTFFTTNESAFGEYLRNNPSYIILMHSGHAQLSFKPPSVAVPPPATAPPLEPLSPLTDSSPSPPLPSDAQTIRTRSASGTTGRPSQRRRDAAEHAAPSTATAPSVRRIRPLACMTSSTNANTQNSGKEKSGKVDAWKAGGAQQEEQQYESVIDFPPKHVVLHPDDVNNKVFLSMGRALMSVVSIHLPLDFYLFRRRCSAMHEPGAFYIL